MVFSTQQKYLLGVLEKLGCARKGQLIDLFRPQFCAEQPEKAEEVGGAALHRLRCCCQQLRETEGVYHLTNAKPDTATLEAIDVMIELTKAQPLDFRKEKTPALLRFSVQEQKVRRFIVAEYGADLSHLRLGPYDRIILLFDGQGQAQPLPVSNKQFFAVRQENGSHRYFAANGQ